ncbi:hypothetical protein KIPB_010840 [Kipferlia bialata]|uniref:Uncharacterized protein n=1 Tax=Kipferlia bialata TaxID=797122 RepID=A0A391NWR8_9EUKA|nr:hypothetical protein KIPB_010840 [Kipferlia bialata]|eukprot:g10840.t1
MPEGAEACLSDLTWLSATDKCHILTLAETLVFACVAPGVRSQISACRMGEVSLTEYSPDSGECRSLPVPSVGSDVPKTYVPMALAVVSGSLTLLYGTEYGPNDAGLYSLSSDGSSWQLTGEPRSAMSTKAVRGMYAVNESTLLLVSGPEVGSPGTTHTVWDMVSGERVRWCGPYSASGTGGVYSVSIGKRGYRLHKAVVDTRLLYPHPSMLWAED